MTPRFVVLVLFAVGACGGHPLYRALRAPNPNGCYVMIFEQPQFRGAGDVLNGPGRWPTLESILQTDEQSWRNRIRSVRVGHAATLTVYTDANFRGEALRLAPQTDHPLLERNFAGRIESLEFACP